MKSSTLSTICGIVLLLAGIYLYTQKDSDYILFSVSGTIVIIVSGLAYMKCRKNKGLQNYFEHFDSLQHSVGKLGASLPTSTVNCIDTSTANGTIIISNAVDKIKTLQKSLRDVYFSLVGNPSDNTSKPSAAWVGASDEDKKSLTDSFTKIDNDCSSFIGRLVTVQKQGPDGTLKTLQKWDSMYMCDDLCSFNGVDIKNDKAVYAIGGQCSCPEGSFPQMDVYDGEFVKCVRDISSFNPVKNQISGLVNDLATNSLTIPKPLAGKAFKFMCGSTQCLSNASLPGELTFDAITKSFSTKKFYILNACASINGPTPAPVIGQTPGAAPKYQVPFVLDSGNRIVRGSNTLLNDDSSFTLIPVSPNNISLDAKNKKYYVDVNITKNDKYATWTKTNKIGSTVYDSPDIYFLKLTDTKTNDNSQIIRLQYTNGCCTSIYYVKDKDTVYTASAVSVADGTTSISGICAYPSSVSSSSCQYFNVVYLDNSVPSSDTSKLEYKAAGSYTNSIPQLLMNCSDYTKCN